MSDETGQSTDGTEHESVLTRVTAFGTDKDIKQKYVTGRSNFQSKSVCHYWEDGYEMVKGESNSGYVMIHRLIAVAEYGLEVVRNMHVHHENGVRWDNRPDNLEPIDPSEHTSNHFKNTSLKKRLKRHPDEHVATSLIKAGYTKAAKTIIENQLQDTGTDHDGGDE